MNYVISRLKQAWKKEKYFHFHQTRYAIALNDYRLKINYQGASRVV